MTEQTNTTDAAQIAALRATIATKHRLSDDDRDVLLTATDEDALTVQARRLAEIRGVAPTEPAWMPRRTNPTTPKPSDGATFTRSLFGGGQ